MIEQPDIRPVSQGGMYDLHTDYSYDGLTVPAGFEYDGASVPRVLWTLTGLLPDGIHRPAALIHDYLYRQGGHCTRYNLPFRYSRRHADRMFRRMLIDLGVMKWRVVILYLGVRLYGATSFGKGT